MPVSRKRHRKRGTATAGAGTDARGPALAVAGLAVVLGFGTWLVMEGPGGNDAAVVAVTVPRLSAEAAAGRATFNDTCAECHGRDGAGSDQGPPLIHAIYRPGHHAKAAIRRAVIQVVRAHNWQFGEIAPLAAMTAH